MLTTLAIVGIGAVVVWVLAAIGVITLPIGVTGLVIGVYLGSLLALWLFKDN